MNITTLHTILHNIAKNENIKNAIINAGESGNKGDGYIGTVKTFELKGSNKTLHLLMKYASPDPYFRKVMPIRESFKCEVYFYEKVVEYFNQLQKDVPFDVVAKCFWSSVDEFKELLVLENLRVGGYEICNRFEPLDANHIELALEAYAKLHAFSFALKQRQPGKFEELASNIGDNMKTWFTKGRMISTTEALNEKYKDRIQDEEQLRRYCRMCDGMRAIMLDYDYTSDRFAAMSHADCWSNNMLFKYKSINGIKKAEQVKLIDFQLSRVASIVYDLSHFLCACTDGTFWENLDYYLKLYYKTLSDLVVKLGGDSKALFSFDEFKVEFKNKSCYGLFLSSFYLKIMLVQSSEAPDIQELTEETTTQIGFLKDIQNQDTYFKRYQYLVDYFYNNNMY